MNTLPRQPTAVASKVSFVTEIMQMMHAFGDGLRSNPDAAHLIEQIVRQQMNSLLDQAIDVALVREANSIGLEEILFVLRKNKIKLSRLYHHLHLKDTIEMVNRNMSGIVRSTLQLNPSTNYYSTNSNYVNECYGQEMASDHTDTGSIISSNVNVIHGNTNVTLATVGNEVSAINDMVQLEQQQQQHHQLQQQQQPHPGTSMVTMVPLQGPTGHCSNFNSTSASAPHATFSSSSNVDYATLGHSSSLMSTDAITGHENVQINTAFRQISTIHQVPQQQQQNQWSSGPVTSKRAKICQEFLQSIDETNQFDALLSEDMQDEIKNARKLRQEKLSRALSKSEYDKFCECRRVSFASSPKKFENWLLHCDQVNNLTLSQLRIHPFAMEAFAYLAYETVAEIVDLCFLVKQAPQNDLGDAVRGLVSLKKQPTRAVHSSFHSSLILNNTCNYQMANSASNTTILASHLQQANSLHQQTNVTCTVPPGGSASASASSSSSVNPNGQNLQTITLGLPLQQQQSMAVSSSTSSASASSSSTHQQELNPSPNGPNGLNDASTNPSHGPKRLRKLEPVDAIQEATEELKSGKIQTTIAPSDVLEVARRFYSISSPFALMAKMEANCVSALLSRKVFTA